VVPKGENAPVLFAQDSYDYASAVYNGQGFPGYSYLSQLATRAEYRAFAAAMSTELTRKGIEFTSKQDDDDERIAQIEKEFDRLKVMQVLSCAAQHDCYFGAAHLYLDIKDADITTPLVIDKRTIPQGSLKGIKTVEPIWTTPSAYNSNDPTRPDFFRPTEWFMLGKRIHASRLLTVITRELRPGEYGVNSGVVGYWKLNDGDYSRVYDSCDTAENTLYTGSLVGNHGVHWNVAPQWIRSDNTIQIDNGTNSSVTDGTIGVRCLYRTALLFNGMQGHIQARSGSVVALSTEDPLQNIFQVTPAADVG
jgi:hypothetical protein